MSVRLFLLSLTVLFLCCPILATNNCSGSQYYNSTSHQCTNCPSSCYSCSDSLTCTVCAPNYFMTNNSCLFCSTPNCASCPNNTCFTCLPNYELTIEGSCVSTNSVFQFAYLIASISLGVIVLFGCCCYCVNRCRESVALRSLNGAPSHALPVR